MCPRTLVFYFEQIVENMFRQGCGRNLEFPPSLHETPPHARKALLLIRRDVEPIHSFHEKVTQCRRLILADALRVLVDQPASLLIGNISRHAPSIYLLYTS